LIVTGCNKTNSDTKHHLFVSKEEALNSFIKEQSTHGPILELKISELETALLYKQMKDVYYLGEIIESEEKFYSERISPGVDIGNTTGAMWTFETSKGNEYTLKISKNKEDIDSLYNKEFELFISIVNGKRDYQDNNVRNVITSNQIVFK